MKQNQLPLSTAMWPPKFFSESSKKNIAHLDNKGLILGLTVFDLVPEQPCECPCEKKDWQHCDFLFTYYKQLSKLNFKKFTESYEDLANKLSSLTNIKINEIVLLVYEKPNNMCSERTILKKWFKEHGIELEEMEVKK
jgi:hypothetical protein